MKSTYILVVSIITIGVFVTGIIISNARASSRTLEFDDNGNVVTTMRLGVNTACSVTCGGSCMMGYNVGILGISLGHIVSCSDATADECLCMGN